MPLPVQEIAPVLVGSSNRVTRNYHSWRDPRRVGPGGKTVVGPGQIVVGPENMKPELYLEKQEVQTGLQVHLAPNWWPDTI